MLALGFGALLLWRMYLGMLDQKTYALKSTILQIPIWWGYIPILASLLLLVVAAALTLRSEIGGRG